MDLLATSWPEPGALEIIAAGVSGDLADAVGYKHTTVSIVGAWRVPSGCG